MHSLYQKEIRLSRLRCKYSVFFIRSRSQINMVKITISNGNVLRIHAEEKPFKCDCGKGYKSQKALETHKKGCASHEKPQCDICQMTFERQTNLNEHKNYEHNEKMKQKCHICKKAFSSNSNLKRHNAKFHAVPENNPGEAPETNPGEEPGEAFENNPGDDPAIEVPQPVEDPANDMPPLEDPVDDQPQMEIRNWLLESSKKRKGDHLESPAKKIHTEERPKQVRNKISNSFSI